jgi:hypothetical protein
MITLKLSNLARRWSAICGDFAKASLTKHMCENNTCTLPRSSKYRPLISPQQSHLVKRLQAMLACVAITYIQGSMGFDNDIGIGGKIRKTCTSLRKGL